jgi:hypothetical protein
MYVKSRTAIINLAPLSLAYLTWRIQTIQGTRKHGPKNRCTEGGYRGVLGRGTPVSHRLDLTPPCPPFVRGGVLGSRAAIRICGSGQSALSSPVAAHCFFRLSGKPIGRRSRPDPFAQRAAATGYRRNRMTDLRRSQRFRARAPRAKHTPEHRRIGPTRAVDPPGTAGSHVNRPTTGRIGKNRSRERAPVPGRAGRGALPPLIPRGEGRGGGSWHRS